MKLRASHQQHGQAIVEGTAFLMIFVPILVALVIFCLYTAISGYYHLMLAQVADAGARSAVHDRYWLGAQRPNYDPATTTANIQTLVGKLWTTIGLPGSVTATVDLSTTDTVTVTVKANGLPIPSGGFLPAALAMEAKAAEPYDLDRPIGTLGMGFMQTGTGGMGIVVPTYGGGGLSDGPYAPSTPGPGSYPTVSTPYWYADVTSSDTPPMPPIRGPYADATLGAPFSSY